MNIALRPPQRVNLVQASVNPPAMAHGTVVKVSGDELEIELDAEAPIFKLASSLIVEFGRDSSLPRAIVVPLRQTAGNLVVRVRRIPPPDKREYPRVEGAVHVVWHVSPTGDAGITAWTIGGPATGPEHTPDPFMNFSATGLLFEDVEACHEGDTLLFSLRIPRADKEWRGAARVVRVSPIPEEEVDPALPATHRVAVHFTHLAEEAVEALRQHTLRIQEAYL